MLSRAVGICLVIMGCRAPPDARQSSEGSLRVSARELDFGAIALGSEDSLTVEASNAGESDLLVSLRVVAPFRVEPGEFMLQRGAARSLLVSFTPERLGPVTAAVDGVPDGLVLAGSGSPPCRAGACRASRFDVGTRTCIETPVEEGASCAVACLAGAGTCLGGACVGDANSSCDDADACTFDGCLDDGGCFHAPRPAPAPRSACETWVCDPQRGFRPEPIDDGTLCGPMTCESARVCINGSCVIRATAASPDDCRYRSVCSYEDRPGRVMTCASTRSGRLRCWGTPELLGRDGGTSAPEFVPGAVKVAKAVCGPIGLAWLDGDGGLHPENVFGPALRSFRDVRTTNWPPNDVSMRALTSDNQLVLSRAGLVTSVASNVAALCGAGHFLRPDGGLFYDSSPEVLASPWPTHDCAGLYSPIALHPGGVASAVFGSLVLLDAGVTAVGASLVGPVALLGAASIDATRRTAGPTWPFEPVVLTQETGELCGLSSDGALACAAVVFGSPLSTRPDRPIEVGDGGLRWIGAVGTARFIDGSGGGFVASPINRSPQRTGASTFQPFPVRSRAPADALSIRCLLAGNDLLCDGPDGGTVERVGVTALVDSRFSPAVAITGRGELIDGSGRVLMTNLEPRPPGLPGLCLVFDDGGVSCGGVPVALPDRARLVSVSGRGGCFLTATQQLWCFFNTVPPERRLLPLGVRLVAGDALQGCALIGTNGVRCWGLGQQFSSVAFDEPVVQLRVDATNQSLACALTQSGRGWCWGDNTLGQLGVAPFDGQSIVPVRE